MQLIVSLSPKSIQNIISSSEVLHHKFKFWAHLTIAERLLSSLSITKIPKIKKIGSLLYAYLYKGSLSLGIYSLDIPVKLKTS